MLGRKELETNALLVLRILANLFEAEEGRSLLVSQYDNVSILWDVADVDSRGSEISLSQGKREESQGRFQQSLHQVFPYTIILIIATLSFSIKRGTQIMPSH